MNVSNIETEHHISNPNSKTMKPAIAFVLTFLSALLLLPNASAQWNKTAAGTYDFNDTANWTSGNMNGVFPGTFTGNQVVTFDQDTNLPAAGSGYALDFGWSGTYNAAFQSDSGTARVLNLGGGIRTTNSRVITLGSVTNPLTLDLGVGNTQTVTAGAWGSKIELRALITGTGGSTLNVGSGSGTVAFLNDGNSFDGDIETNGMVWFSSLTNAGQNSALGAGGAITVNSTGALSYVGAGAATSNRALHLAASTNTLAVGSGGDLALTGTIQAANGANRTLNIINANGKKVELSGPILNQTDGINHLNLSKTGAGQLTIRGLENDYLGSTTHLVDTLAYRSIANLGENSSLGAPVTVSDGTIHLGSDSSTAFSYIGEGNSASNRSISLESTDNAFSILNVDGSGSLVISGDILTNLSVKAQSFRLSGSGSGTGTITGIISDSPGGNATSILKGGSGVWTLTGNNTFTGGVAIANSQGTLQFSSVANSGNASALGASGTITLGGAGSTLKYIGSGNSVTDRTIDLNTSGGSTTYALDASGAGSITYVGNVTATTDQNKTLFLTGTSVADNAILGAIGQTSLAYTTGLQKYDSGTWTLAGTNTYTGETHAYGGTLRLDFSRAGSPQNDIINSASTLALNGGTLEIKGNSTGTTSQTFAATKVGVVGLVNAYGHSKVDVDSNGGTGTTLALGNLTRNSGATVDFVLPGNGSITTTNATLTNNVLVGPDGAYATVNGADWATVSGGAIVALAGANYTTSTDSSTWGAADNLWLSANANVSTTKDVNTLKLDNGASVTIGSGQTLRLGVGGLLITDGSGSISGGKLRGKTGWSGELLVFQNDASNTFEISSVIESQGGFGSVTKSGAGALRLSGLNTYAGATIINEGVVEVDVLANGGTASGIGVGSGASPGYLVFNGGTLRYTGAGSSTNRGLTIGLSGATLEASGSGAVIFGGNTAAYTNYAIRDLSLTLTGSNTGNNTFGGVIANPLSNRVALTKEGAGTWVLTGNNTYTGLTDVRQGKLLVNGALSASGVVEIQNGASLGGSGSVGVVKVHSGATITPGNSIGVLNAGNTFLEGGGQFLLEMNTSGTGTAGTNWDQYAVAGTLILNELSPGSPFVVKLQTLNQDGDPGSLASWDPDVDHVWASVFSTTGGYYGAFDSSLFTVNTAGFNGTLNGAFSIEQNGNALDLLYTAVPEPGIYGLLIVGSLLLGAFSRHRKT